MPPTKLSSKIFLELPPVLAHYIEGDRCQWLELNPSRGKLTLLDRVGVFVDAEHLAVERRHWLEILGVSRSRMLAYRVGFEQGRRDAHRHFGVFESNTRLALQAGQVFGQLEGRYTAEPIRFEFDLDARTLYGEILLRGNTEATTHRVGLDPLDYPVCWYTAGYFAGHISEIVGRRVITSETECIAKGDPCCRFVSKLDPEWGGEADWARLALKMTSIEAELTQRDERLAAARQELHRVQASLNDLNRRLRSDLMLESMVAASESMETPMKRARAAMTTPAPVLIVGERGTGRATLARALHAGGPRKNRPYVAIDCAGLTPALLNQELFGFAKDAVSGAVRPYAGALERANGGSIYIEEITKLGPETQGQLLRAMQDGTVTPLGAEAPVKVDVRIIAATQMDPRQAMASGVLREDIYYALAIAQIELPPLRERGDDILRLADAFLREAQARYQRADTAMAPEFKKALLDCAWPGNLRQLRNVIEHAVLMSSGAALAAEDLPDDILATRIAPAPQELSPEVIRAALRRTKGNRSHAAKLLNVGRTTLWRALKRMGLE
ncbi:MAG: sigma 54-interacting transcriptional regulator [Candidatus Hydrogenedentes bacterium]|nr:sigma 54-interacting transcriptional regulator [Candidatus Hydrogenedentota bacterium]